VTIAVADWQSSLALVIGAGLYGGFPSMVAVGWRGMLGRGPLALLAPLMCGPPTARRSAIRCSPTGSPARWAGWSAWVQQHGIHIRLRAASSPHRRLGRVPYRGSVLTVGCVSPPG